MGLLKVERSFDEALNWVFSRMGTTAQGKVVYFSICNSKD